MSTIFPKKSLKKEERNAIYHELLEKSSKAKWKLGSIKHRAKKFGVSKKKISRVWYRREEIESSCIGVVNISSRK